MDYDYRSLVESLDSIMNEEDSVEVESSKELSPQELLKDIVHGIGCVVDCLSSNEIEDYDEFLNKLKNVKETLDSIHGSSYNTSHQDEMLDEEKLPLDNIEGNEYGAGGMGPRIDSNGKQHYEKKSGSSYAERHGFVGP